VASEKELCEKFLAPLTVCKRYMPKFGQGNKEAGVSLPQFLNLYGSDPFYSWCGLDTPLMYSAHKAAGGMTSVYRQVGTGCESLFREIIIDSTRYTDRDSAAWSYKTKTSAGKDKTLTLDGRLEFDDIRDPGVKKRVMAWVTEYCRVIEASVPTRGVVFEVRQGYKSKDSKRQNGDIDNVAVAWAQGYMPVFAIFSAQIDGDLVLRYRNHRAGIIVGRTDGSSIESLFVFCQEILGFDLIGFFTRNSPAIKKEMHATLEALLNA
jgi:hypothetical protein